MTIAPEIPAINIDDLFSAQDKRLNDEMDVLLFAFQLTQPGFYNDYQNAKYSPILQNRRRPFPMKLLTVTNPYKHINK